MTLQEMLDSLDAVVQMVSASMQASDAVAIEQSSTRLRDAMVAFSQLSKRFNAKDWTPELRERAAQLGDALNLMRDQMARLSVLAQRRAQALVPMSGDDTTYESRLLGKPQAGQGRARIYHAAS